MFGGRSNLFSIGPHSRPKISKKFTARNWKLILQPDSVRLRICDKSVERSVQMASTTSNIFQKETVLNELFQHAFDFFLTLSATLNDYLKRSRHLVQQNVERMLKQILKPFKQASTNTELVASLHYVCTLLSNSNFQGNIFAAKFIHPIRFLGVQTE